ncbi:MAG TPA: prephenate dehydrogenase/arogenate dehydrogenase family protein [Terriglobia bacterium]|nr:prephenate dehydrogenase/arogenate dehydrogenase family protein [Terriglobia bacterium]
MSPPANRFSRIAIAGFGLIGGSWALALKRRGFPGRIVVSDRAEVARRALDLGAADEAQSDPAAAARGADLVILAAPVGTILEQLPVVRSAAPNALVTDTGGTKRAILNRARENFGEGLLFLGGHPLAGKEHSGIENADPDLFEKSRYVLTPLRPEDLNDPRAQAFQALLRSVGARPVVIGAEEHDRALAVLSHLPQLLSTALAAVAGEEDPALPLELAAGGFRDMTRLADSAYAIWRDVGMTNADNLHAALDALISRLENMKEHLNDEQLVRDFDQAHRLRERWRKLS